VNLNNKPPVFVPQEHWAELERLSKAALMDMVWDYAEQIACADGDPTAIMAEFRARREIILNYRNYRKSGWP
jgi:hypothetical protein